MSQVNDGNYIKRTSLAALLVLSVAAVALAQQKPVSAPTPANETPAAKDTISGKYEGTAKAEIGRAHV